MICWPAFQRLSSASAKFSEKLAAGSTRPMTYTPDAVSGIGVSHGTGPRISLEARRKSSGTDSIAQSPLLVSLCVSTVYDSPFSANVPSQRPRHFVMPTKVGTHDRHQRPAIRRARVDPGLRRDDGWKYDERYRHFVMPAEAGTHDKFQRGGCRMGCAADPARTKKLADSSRGSRPARDDGGCGGDACETSVAIRRVPAEFG
jgi:hypothetical protein